MPEISTVAVITAKPGSGDDVEQALRTLAAATHGEEGCLRYSLHRTVQDPNVFVTVEKWRSQEDLDAHLSSPHLQEALAAAGDLMAAPPNIMPAEPLDLGADEKGAF